MTELGAGSHRQGGTTDKYFICSSFKGFVKTNKEYALCFCPTLSRRHTAIPSSSSHFCWNEHFCFQTSWQHPNPSHVLCSGRIINKMVISGFKGHKNITPIPCLLQIIAFTLTQHKICAVAHSVEDIIYCLGGVSFFALMSTLGNKTGVIL